MLHLRSRLKRRNVPITIALLLVLIGGFLAGFYYVTLSNLRQTGYGWSGLIVNYVSVNGQSISSGAAASGYEGYTSSCCMVDCSAWEGFGANRIFALNQQNPPKVSCSFRIVANTTGYILMNVFNTDWDYDYAARFSTSSSDRTVTFTSLPSCLSGCYVNATASHWFRFDFAAKPSHNPAADVTLSITVMGY